MVDDGSTDHTAAEASKAGARVIRHATKCGKGAALRTGFGALQQEGFPWALTIDGDGQHDPADVPAMVRKAEQEQLDLVVGNRMSEAGSLPLLRRWTNRWMSYLISRRTGFDCPDSQCGFRLLRVQAWAQVDLRTDFFEVESELLLAFARAGFKVGFVPVRCLKAGRPSRIHPWHDSVRWLKWWLS